MINCVQELPENGLAIISATKECTTVPVEDGVMETNIKTAVRRFIFILRYF